MVANFAVQSLVWLFAELNTLVSLAAHNKGIESQYGYEATAQTPKGQEAKRGAAECAESVLKMTEGLLGVMKNNHILNAQDRLRGWVRNDEKQWDDLFIRACALRDAIRIECGEYLYYAYPKDRGQKLTQWKSDWEKIVAAFPDVEIESYAATDCYALTHNTASVFHSMRVAEIGLRTLAKERRIRLPRNKAVEWGTWQETIKALDDEIRSIGQTWKPGRRKDTALEFYSGARADLNGFKDEYRNLVMHVRLHYDSFQAARALARVHDFMSRLAGKLDHKHHRINWGRSS